MLSRTSFLRSLPVLLVVGLVLPGCRDREIHSYSVAKETPAATPAPESTPHAHVADKTAQATMASTPVPTAGGNDLTWTAPASWASRPASAMRKATYVITGEGGATAELAVTAFPGNVGGNLANVNRWRGQLQLPPLSEDALPAALEHIHANGLHIDVVDLLGPEGAERQRVLGAIVPVKGSTWFFKLTGPAALIAQEKAAFLAFLQTLKTS